MKENPWPVVTKHDRDERYGVVSSDDGGPSMLGCRFVDIQPQQSWNTMGPPVALSFRFMRTTPEGTSELKVQVPTEDVLKDCQKRIEAALGKMRFDGGVETTIEVGPHIR